MSGVLCALKKIRPGFYSVAPQSCSAHALNITLPLVEVIMIERFRNFFFRSRMGFSLCLTLLYVRRELHLAEFQLQIYV